MQITEQPSAVAQNRPLSFFSTNGNYFHLGLYIPPLLLSGLRLTRHSYSAHLTPQGDFERTKGQATQSQDADWICDGNRSLLSPRRTGIHSLTSSLEVWAERLHPELPTTRGKAAALGSCRAGLCALCTGGNSLCLGYWAHFKYSW